MSKVSRESAQVEDHGPVEDRHGEMDGYTVSFVSFREGVRCDRPPPMPKDESDLRYHCPHWGYMVKGKLSFGFGDHEEVFEAGDAFYLPPGHIPYVPWAEAGSEYVWFSPTEELREATQAMMKDMQEMHGA
jgi:hypothetical protein